MGHNTGSYCEMVPGQAGSAHGHIHRSCRSSLGTATTVILGHRTLCDTASTTRPPYQLIDQCTMHQAQASRFYSAPHKPRPHIIRTCSIVSAFSCRPASCSHSSHVPPPSAVHLFGAPFCVSLEPCPNCTSVPGPKTTFHSPALMAILSSLPLTSTAPLPSCCRCCMIL